MLRETGNSALEADPRIPPNQKKIKNKIFFLTLLFRQFEGRGKYFFANGDRYEGDFQNGERHGDGIMFFTSGGFREGTWSRDSLVGEVRVKRLDRKEVSPCLQRFPAFLFSLFSMLIMLPCFCT